MSATYDAHQAELQVISKRIAEIEAERRRLIRAEVDLLRHLTVEEHRRTT